MSNDPEENFEKTKLLMEGLMITSIWNQFHNFTSSRVPHFIGSKEETEKV